MKYAYIALAFLPALCAQAQWSTDAANPMVVCNAANDQRFMRAIPDGYTGWYVFWSDLRNNTNKADLYGQHFDAEGSALWTPNGTQLLTLPVSSVNEVAPVVLANGNVMLAVLSSANNTNNADTVRAVLIDANGNMLWTEPALLSVNGPGVFGNCFSFSIPRGIASGDGVYFCYHGDSQGSNGYYVM